MIGVTRMKKVFQRNVVLFLAFLFLGNFETFVNAEEVKNLALNLPKTSEMAKLAPSISDLPIQSGGRVKPLDSLARESVLLITGKRSWNGQPPIATLLDWISRPEEFENVPFIWVSKQQVRRQLTLDEKRLYFSPKELSENPVLIQYAQTNAGSPDGVQVVPGQVGAVVQDPRADELRRVFQRLSIYRRIVSGELLTFLVLPGSERGADDEPAFISVADPAASGDPIQASFLGLLKAYNGTDRNEFLSAARDLYYLVLYRAYPQDEKRNSVIGLLKVEVIYKKLRPFLWSWVFYLLSALLGVIFFKKVTATEKLGLGEKWKALWPSLLSAGCGLFFHILGFGLRCYVAGRPPVTNMYESIVWVSLGASVFAFGFLLYEVFVTRGKIHSVFTVFLASQCVAALGLVISDAAPALLDPSLQPLVPVLRSNIWLTIHVLSITLSYGAFAVALAVSNVALWGIIREGLFGRFKKSTEETTRAEIPLNAGPVKKPAGQRLVELNDWSYRAIQFGVVLLAAGIILGGVWADYSWGRFWGWDPKETWALIALIGYLLLLHARYIGWIGPFGFSVASVVAFLGVVMAWYGVNFVLGAGLHSYGFSSGGSVPVAIACLLQIGYLFWAAGMRKSRRS